MGVTRLTGLETAEAGINPLERGNLPWFAYGHHLG